MLELPFLFLYGETRAGNSCLEGCGESPVPGPAAALAPSLQRDLVLAVCSSSVTACLATKRIICTICKNYIREEGSQGTNLKHAKPFGLILERLLVLQLWL